MKKLKSLTINLKKLKLSYFFFQIVLLSVSACLATETPADTAALTVPAAVVAPYPYLLPSVATVKVSDIFPYKH